MNLKQEGIISIIMIILNLIFIFLTVTKKPVDIINYILMYISFVFAYGYMIPIFWVIDKRIKTKKKNETETETEAELIFMDQSGFWGEPSIDPEQNKLEGSEKKWVKWKK